MVLCAPLHLRKLNMYDEISNVRFLMSALQTDKLFTPLVQSFAIANKKPEYFYSGFILND